jgi:glycosyltransferase involved in cell wall biosynthesis
MRIGLLTTSFPRYPGDVAGQFVLGFARSLVALGHQVDVLAPEPSGAYCAPAWPNLTVHWTPYMRPRQLAQTFYGAGVPDNLRHNVFAWLGLAPFIASLTRQTRKARENWDAMVSHWAIPCALVAGALREDRKNIAVFHSADLHLLSKLPARGPIALELARTSDRLVFVAPVLRDLFLSFLPKNQRSVVALRCSVLPMGIEPIAPPSAPRDLLRAQWGLDRFTLLFIGRLVEVKGVSEAILGVSERRDLELVIMGDGPERGLLETIARRHRAPVRFLGQITGQAKHDWLSAADAFVNPSVILPSGRTEGVPTALIEAMAHGLPIIATEVGGVGSLIEDEKTGLLVKPGDAMALRAAVDRLVCDPGLCARLAVQCQLRGQALTWPSMAPKIAALFN